MLISKEFDFDAAHRIVGYQGKCENLHGHRWKIRITLKAPVGESGIAFDFVKLKQIVQKKIISKLDHSYLNKIIRQPSSENIAIWIWNKLKGLPLEEIIVWESETSFVTYKGEDRERC